MNHFEDRGGRLFIGGVEAEKLADEYGTPLYVYDGDRIRDNFYRIREALERYSDRDIRILYSVKANSSLAIMKILSDSGSSVDVVSPYEARLALDAGFPKERIMFTGTSVSDEDLKLLLDMGITINMDSFSQMRRLAGMSNRDVDVSIRWNPGEGAGHHEHVITAGDVIEAGKYIKFGIPEDRILEAFEEALRLGLRPKGLHQHIGSGWLDSDVDLFLGTVDSTLRVARGASEILGYELDFVDFGGGPGIIYRPEGREFPLDKYARGICTKVRESGLGFKSIMIEPGRYIVGDAGVLLTRINTVESKGVPIIGVDSGFGTLIRPAFYGAYHEMLICSKVGWRPDNEWMVAGNLCETGDVFNENQKLRPLPTPEEGDVLAILNAGAYGFSMSSRYNSRPLPAEVLISDGKHRLIRKRESYEDLLAGQNL